MPHPCHAHATSVSRTMSRIYLVSEVSVTSGVDVRASKHNAINACGRGRHPDMGTQS